MSLDQERLHILRALAHEADTSFLHEPALVGRIRGLVHRMNDPDPDRKKECVRQLAGEYAKHGPAVFRCLLDHCYLLNVAIEAGSLFRTVLDKLEADLKRDGRLCIPLINELGRHIRSPDDATQKLVELILERCAHVPGLLTKIISNNEAQFDLRFKAVEQAIRLKDVQTYEAILAFVRETSKHRGMESFRTGLLPLAKILGQTGPEGLALAIESFKKGVLGRHAPLILASFESAFHTWFYSAVPEPSREWVKVLALAWHRTADAKARQRMLGTLVNDWCARPDLAEYIVDVIRQHVHDRPDYLKPAGALASEIGNYVGVDPDYETRKAKGIREAATSGGLNWTKYGDWEPRDRIDGRAAAAAYYDAPSPIQDQILTWIQSRRNSRFQSAAYYGILKPSRFRNLSPAKQVLVLQSPNLAARVQANCFEELLELSHLEPGVRGRLQDVLTSVIRDHQLGQSDDGEGDLS